MLLCAVNTLQIVNVNHPAAVSVEFLESADHKLFSELIQIGSDRPHQLFVANFTALVRIELIEKITAFFLRNIQPKVAKSFPELLNIEVTVVVVVHDLEDSLNAEDAASAPLSKHLPEHLGQLVVVVPHVLVLTLIGALRILSPPHPRGIVLT